MSKENPEVVYFADIEEDVVGAPGEQEFPGDETEEASIQTPEGVVESSESDLADSPASEIAKVRESLGLGGAEEGGSRLEVIPERADTPEERAYREQMERYETEKKEFKEYDAESQNIKNDPEYRAFEGKIDKWENQHGYNWKSASVGGKIERVAKILRSSAGVCAGAAVSAPGYYMLAGEAILTNPVTLGAAFVGGGALFAGEAMKMYRRYKERKGHGEQDTYFIETLTKRLGNNRYIPTKERLAADVYQMQNR